MKLFWLDLETTGLDPINNYPLEIVVYEAELETPFDVKKIYGAVFRYSGPTIYTDKFVREMHTNNGLWLECMNSKIEPYQAEEELLKIVPEAPDRESLSVLAGSSIHFDHEFLKNHMPTLAKRFSHRHYDVSAVMLFARSMGMPKLPKAEAHRAEADVLESIVNARKCAEWFAEESSRYSIEDALYPAHRQKNLKAGICTCGPEALRVGYASDCVFHGQFISCAWTK